MNNLNKICTFGKCRFGSIIDAENNIYFIVQLIFTRLPWSSRMQEMRLVYEKFSAKNWGGLVWKPDPNHYVSFRLSRLIAVDIDSGDSFFLFIKNCNLHCGLEGLRWTCETRPALTCSGLRGSISGGSWTTRETLAPKHRNTDSSTDSTFPLPFYFYCFLLIGSRRFCRCFLIYSIAFIVDSRLAYINQCQKRWIFCQLLIRGDIALSRG